MGRPFWATGGGTAPSPYLFDEEFDYVGGPDPTKWTTIIHSTDCGNCTVDGNYLHMPGAKTGGPTYGSIWTDHFFSQKTVEIRADFLMPTNSYGHQILIYTDVGSFIQLGKPSAPSTQLLFRTFDGSTLSQSAINVSSGFHVFKVVWTPTSIQLYLDGVPGPIHAEAITGNARIIIYGITTPIPSGACQGPVLYDFMRVYL